MSTETTPTPGTLARGTLLDGKYEVLELLGAGGMGEVYKARHVHLGAFRCIKVMKTALLADENYRQRFLREARLATQIHHPNVAVVHDFSVLENGSNYMVTEFIEGTTVRQWEVANGRFPLPLAIEVALQVLEGLDYIHRRELLHRDISADNVMLFFDAEDHLQVKIIDLGVAKDVSQDADTTQIGIFLGNPRYMSPEQLGELPQDEVLDGRADLYSLGVVLYEMLAGAPPFQARTPNGYIIQHLTQRPPAFRETNPALDLPAGLEAAVLRAMEKDRQKRFANAREFAEALRPWSTRSERAFSRTDIPLDEEGRAAELAWKMALAGDTYNAMRDFRARYPRHRADQAERALAERLAFESAAAMDTEDAWSDYLEKWSADRHAPLAEERLEAARVREETAYNVALSAKNAVAWQAFLEEFPNGKLSAHAETHLREALAFDAARRGGREGLEEFLRAWPSELLASEAKRLLQEITEPEDDERAWDEARRAGTAEALQAYLKVRPEGRFAADARRSLARLAIIEGDFNAAWEAGTVAAFDEYLARYPDAPRVEEARRCRQEAAEYEMAERVNTKTMWRAFLKAWPEGRHRLDVEVRLRN